MIEFEMPQKMGEGYGEATSTERSVEPGSENLEVVLWTRRPVCGARTEVIDRLSELQAAGDIADYTIRTWPDEVALTEHTEHAPVVEVYEEFRAWAVEAGVSITPPFERRTTTSLVGGTTEVLTVPVLCLAVYRDGDMRGVYPCADGETTWTVTDFLDAYEDVEELAVLAERRDLPVTVD